MNESFAAHVVRRMRELEFVPTGNFGMAAIEFRRVLMDREGRQVAVTVYFDKPALGMPDVTLSSIIVATQIAIAPESEAIATFAPEEIQSDLFDVIREFASPALSEQPVMQRRCVVCRRDAAEFYVVNDDVICYACVRDRRKDTRSSGA